MGIFHIGTCSWTDPTLLKSGWYPREAKTAEARLEFYSQSFDIVEVDSTYYSLLPQRTAGLWVERTPERFIFNYSREYRNPWILLEFKRFPRFGGQSP